MTTEPGSEVTDSPHFTVTPGWEHDDFIHAWWVEPDRILAGEYPGHPDHARATDKIGILIDRGVRTFLDLTTAEDNLEPYERLVDEASSARQLDLRVLHHPITDLSVTADEHYNRIVADITSASQRGAVYVHCWGGVGRTGTVVGALLAERDMSAEQVLGTIEDLRAGSRKAHRQCPETAEQRRVIESRAEQRSIERNRP